MNDQEEKSQSFMKKNFSKASVAVIIGALALFLVTEIYIFKQMNYYRSVSRAYETNDYLGSLRNILKDGHARQNQP